MTISTYFTTQLEVAHDNADLGTSDDENQKDQEQEAEQIVELMRPDRGQDEKQLNKHGTEG